MRQNITPEDLTKAGEKLLFVLSDPKNYLKTITDVCKIAKISRVHYYWLYKNDKFREQAIALAKQIFASAAPAVAHKVAEEAIKGSLAHQEIILEATGVIRPQGAPTIAQQFGNVTYVIETTKDEKDFVETPSKTE